MSNSSGGKMGLNYHIKNNSFRGKSQKKTRYLPGNAFFLFLSPEVNSHSGMSRIIDGPFNFIF